MKKISQYLELKKYERFNPSNTVIDFDKIYREDSKCTFTDLKVFVLAYINRDTFNKEYTVCHNELFVEPIVNNTNDTKTLDVSIFFKPTYPGTYVDILLIVQKMDFS